MRRQFRGAGRDFRPSRQRDGGARVRARWWASRRSRANEGGRRTMSTRAPGKGGASRPSCRACATVWRRRACMWSPSCRASVADRHDRGAPTCPERPDRAARRGGRGHRQGGPAGEERDLTCDPSGESVMAIIRGWARHPGTKVFKKTSPLESRPLAGLSARSVNVWRILRVIPPRTGKKSAKPATGLANPPWPCCGFNT